MRLYFFIFITYNSDTLETPIYSLLLHRLQSYLLRPIHPIPVDFSIDRHQYQCASRHQHRTHRKQPHAPRHRYSLEKRIGVVAVVQEAPFDPEPVEECQGAAKPHCSGKGDSPGRGEEEEVDKEDDGGNSMEAEVCRRAVG